MKALVWDGQAAALLDRDVPTPGPGEALVQVLLAGICNTDLEIARGYMNFRGVLGHEFVGRVVEGPAAWQGARVVCEINFACGACEACERGLERHCPARRVLGIQGADGAFAEFVCVPIANLHRVPDPLQDEAAVFCEPLAAAFEILEQVGAGPETRCRVYGDGKLGVLVAQVLQSTGAQVEVVGRHETKLATLRALGIATRLAKPADGSGARDLVDLSVEATGSPEGLRMAIAGTRPRGTLVLKSTVAERHRVDLAAIVIHEISIVGSRCGPFAPALRALAEGRVTVAPLISERISLSRAPEALERAAQRGVLKVLLDCRSGLP